MEGRGSMQGIHTFSGNRRWKQADSEATVTADSGWPSGGQPKGVARCCQAR